MNTLVALSVAGRSVLLLFQRSATSTPLQTAGGESVYVRDPDGHSVELVTPGLWAIY